jgi:hypothetical protein
LALSALGGLALLSACPSPAAAAESTSPPGFCSTAVVRDYAAPLEAMPAVRPLPADGELPFGPSRLRVRRLEFWPQSNPALLTEAGKVGFRLGFSAAAPSGRLGWQVTARLLRVSRDRLRDRLVARRDLRVERLHPGRGPRLEFSVGEEPSFYRLELEFRDAAGHRLGRFGAYYRMMAPVSDLRLAVNGSTFHPGETVSTCIENFGNRERTYGECTLGFQREEAPGVWSPYPSAPQACSAVGYFLAAGHATQGGSLTIPLNAPPGRYRAVFGEASAEFQVTPQT